MKNMICVLVTLLFSINVFAQSSVDSQVSPMKRADALSVKASLESMLARRYTQELSSVVSSEHFNIGTRFELKVANQPSSDEPAGYTDLDLGYLDADQLFDDYALEAMSPLEKYSVKSVQVNVGLQPDMTDDAKKSVEEWLEARVKEEFGAIGTSKVQYIKNPGKTNSPMLRKIKDLQGLVGNVILGFCILLGVLLWKLLMGKSSSAENESAATSSVQIQSNTESTISGAMGGAQEDEATEKLYVKKIATLSSQIKDLAPQLVEQVETLINQWSEKGEEGLNQIACFAEISGSVLGSLPIPAEHKKKMGGIFAQMHEMTNEKRHEITNKVYWDMVASLNLGSDALHRPFSFISNSAMGEVNKVLLGNDVDTQTVVTMYMPENMRKSYVNDLTQDQKVSLLNSAAKLSAITEESLQSIEDNIAPYFGEKQEESKVSMSLTLTKLIDVMSFTESCAILPTIEGPVIQAFKEAEPHVAFLSEWSKESLSYIAKKATTEELLTYLRVVPSMKPYVLEFVSPRAQQILSDDLDQPDTMQEADKEAHLSSLNSLMMKLVSSGEINFYETMKKEEPKQGLKLAA